MGLFSRGKPKAPAETPKAKESAAKEAVQSACKAVIEEAGEVAERLRVSKLRGMGVLHKQGNKTFMDIVALAMQLAGTASACIMLIDEETCFVQARADAVPAANPILMPRGESFCNVTIKPASGDQVVVLDASKDDRFKGLEFTTSGAIRFYAGVPLVTSDGYRVGALCVIDPKPRPEPPPQIMERLALLARIATELLEFSKPPEKLVAA